MQRDAEQLKQQFLAPLELQETSQKQHKKQHSISKYMVMILLKKLYNKKRSHHC